MLVCVLDHDNSRVDHRSDGDGDAAEAHDVGANPEQPHGNERHQDAHGEHQNRNQSAAHVQQEDHAHQGDDKAFLEQRRFEGCDGAVDQL